VVAVAFFMESSDTTILYTAVPAISGRRLLLASEGAGASALVPGIVALIANSRYEQYGFTTTVP
jgi:hypothetical protein